MHFFFFYNAEVNPASQYVSLNFCPSTKGLDKPTVLGNASANSLDKPLFIDAFILTTFCSPSEVRCSSAFIILTAILNK